MQHILEAQQFDKNFLTSLFNNTDMIKGSGTRSVGSWAGDCRDKIMATVFYEPSTRTRFSFEAAMHRLGGSVISTENATQFSSVTKGENLEDTIITISSYVDVIVLRHNEEGAAKRAARVSSVPIVNAGDGEGQHPTQALIDLYTIQKEFGTIDGLTIGLIGDLEKGRTTHSLAYLLAKYDIKKLYLGAPNIWQMKSEILDYLKRHNVNYELVYTLNDILPEVDVLYQTRLQKERWNSFHDYAKVEEALIDFMIDKNSLRIMKKDARILHPFPRLNELSKDVDIDDRAAYFRQIENGLFVRMALLHNIL